MNLNDWQTTDSLISGVQSNIPFTTRGPEFNSWAGILLLKISQVIIILTPSLIGSEMARCSFLTNCYIALSHRVKIVKFMMYSNVMHYTTFTTTRFLSGVSIESRTGVELRQSTKTTTYIKKVHAVFIHNHTCSFYTQSYMQFLYTINF